MKTILQKPLLNQILEPATLIKRYKRFLADVEMPGGKILTVHCPNPGSMLGLAEPGLPVWLREASTKDRRLAYTWVLSQLPSGFVCVDTLMANKIVTQALENGFITELSQYSVIQKEKTFASSRFDFFLTDKKNSQECFMEVKSATLADGNLAMFPDAKTKRGCKHLTDLMSCLRSGFRAIQFYCVARTDCLYFSCAHHIDPEYGLLLKQAQAQGVEILAYSVSIEPFEHSFSFALSKPLLVRP